jgi:hypothetical protein
MAFYRTRAWFTCAIASLSLIFASNASAVADNGNIIDIPTINSPVVIDGELNEQSWQQGRTVELNISTSPYDNIPAPVKTLARVMEDENQLYIAFVADDPEPQNIIAYLRDRDKSVTDDLVGIKLDPFNDHRLAYIFMVNPLGAQVDGIDNEMTRENSYLWDGIWQAAGKMTANGYQVEMAIPFRILNFNDSGENKTWAIEFIRMYPRDDRHRLSNVSKDRDNSCSICQMSEINGFKNARAGQNIMVTPSVVASRTEERDLYSDAPEWQDDNAIDLGLDLRWAITQDNLLNLTLNPDFSTVEADAGQLSVNTTFSLFYEEKRPFFLDNADYFSSNYNLVYTRNIGDPDYGIKFTGKSGQHSYGLFITNDSETNFILPGNLGSDIAMLKEESHNGALRYRFDANDDLSLGLISTFRKSDHYHNLVSGIDGKYMLSPSDTLTAQYLVSNTEYPEELFSSLCDQTFCIEPYLRTAKQDDFSDQAFKLAVERQTEFWRVNLNYEDIGADFRADLGYMPKTDYNRFSSLVGHTWYGEQDSLWTEVYSHAKYSISHNENDELLTKEWQAYTGVYGPMLSWLEVVFTHAQGTGLRDNTMSLAIDGNTSLHTTDELALWAEFQPLPALFVGSALVLGEQIDYDNDRVGDIREISPMVVYNATRHLEFTLSHTYSRLDADGAEVYTANLTDLRVNYQFDLRSALQLSVVYSKVDRNKDNYQLDAWQDNWYTENEDDLSTQLIYSYKVNPQTVFFLGYSDLSLENDDIGSLKQSERTAFMKISYAWMG